MPWLAQAADAAAASIINCADVRIVQGEKGLPCLQRACWPGVFAMSLEVAHMGAGIRGTCAMLLYRCIQ